MTTDSINFKVGAESKKVMIKELAIVNSLIPDDDNTVDNLNGYFKNLGV